MLWPFPFQVGRIVQTNITSMQQRSRPEGEVGTDNYRNKMILSKVWDIRQNIYEENCTKWKKNKKITTINNMWLVQHLKLTAAVQLSTLRSFPIFTHCVLPLLISCYAVPRRVVGSLARPSPYVYTTARPRHKGAGGQYHLCFISQFGSPFTFVRSLIHEFCTIQYRISG